MPALPFVPVTCDETHITCDTTWITCDGMVPIQTPRGRVLIGSTGLASS